MKKIVKRIVLVAVYISIMTGAVWFIKSIRIQEAAMVEKQQLMAELEELQKQIEACQKELDEENKILVQEQGKLEEINAEVLRVSEYKPRLKERLEANEELYHLDFEALVLNYDVERFQAYAQSKKAGTGIISSVFGALLGGSSAEDTESALNTLYSNRAKFNRYMLYWILPTMSRMTEASSVYDGSYTRYRQMLETEDIQQCSRNLAVLESLGQEWETELLEEEKNALLEAMAEYRYQLEIFYDLNAMILNDAEYLGEIKSQLNTMDALLAKWDPDGELGYDEATCRELLVEAMDTYVNTIVVMISTYPKDPAFPTIGGIQGNTKRNELAYYNETGKKVYIRIGNFQAYYDAEGNPMKISYGGNVYLQEGRVITHDCESEEAMLAKVDYAREKYAKFEEQYVD